MKTIMFLIIAPICFLAGGCVQITHETIDISDGWKMKVGDNLEYVKPSFNDSDWKAIQVGRNWETEGYADYDGIAFYRRKVVIPSSFKRANQMNINVLQLSLGKIDDADIVYFNGKEIGKTNGWEIQREYAVPFEIINWDTENLISIRVQDTGGGGGFYQGPYQIAAFDKISNLVEITLDNILTECSKENFELSKTLYFHVNGLLEKLPSQLSINIYNSANGDIVFEKNYSLNIGSKSDSSFTYSVKLKNPGFYRAKYSLNSALLRDTLTSNTLLTYTMGDHSNEHIVKPIISNKIPGQAIPFDLHLIHLSGYLGDRLNANIDERLLKIDEKGILECFYNRPGSQTWVGEYAGKYLHAAARVWRNSGNSQLKKQMDRIVDILISCQLEDGYLGTYLPSRYWTDWDIWAHKYDLLGLLSYYEVTGYQPALQTSVKIGDLMCKTFGNNPGQLNIEETGGHVGMASCSILEPMTELYRFTGDKKYLDFCNYIIEAYDHPNGPKIITTLNETGKVNKTANGKAYEMMSNLTGIVKLYQLTGDPKLLSAVEKAWIDISVNRLYITGTSSKGEMFQDDFVFPADNSVHMGEGCVSTTWLQFSQAMYNLKGESKYIDEIEKTICNHLLAAENPQTGCVSYYTALQGVKPYRCTIMGHCCLASVPRGIAAIPELVFTKSTLSGCNINIYSTGEFNDSLKTAEGQLVDVKLSMSSNFPELGLAEITLALDKQASFNIALRVPVWCKNFIAKVDGAKYKGIPGQYLNLSRNWKRNAIIQISFDLNVQELDGGMSYPGFVAIKSGTQVLAYDQALNPEITDVDKIEIGKMDIHLLQKTELPEFWVGSQVYGLNAICNKKPVFLKLVPFADAGQSGGEVRVWMKKH